MRLHDLFPALSSGPDTEITGLTANSGQIKPGMMFVALRGMRADGRDFIEDALRRGASAILTDKRPGSWPVPVMKVDNLANALAQAAARFYQDQPETLVAITGTNGKSSVAEFLRQIWVGCGHESALSMGTLGIVGADTNAGDRKSLSGMTTPDPVTLHRTLKQIAENGTDRVALEASSHGLAQHRLHGVKLAAGAFTNLTQDHLDYHKNFQDYGKAKLKLFSELLPAGAPVVICLDDPSAHYFVEAAHKRQLDCIGLGRDSSATMQVVSLRPVRGGQIIDAKWQGRSFQLRLPLIGAFQAYNALMAATLGLALGEDRVHVFATIEKLRGIPGRLQRIGYSCEGAPAYIDYAHTPAAMSAALQAVRAHTKGRIICVFGCGGNRDADKRSKMGHVAHKLADAVIITDDNPRREDPARIRQAIRSSVPGSVEIGDRAEAIQAGVSMLEPGDSLLVLGKGHETEQILADRTIAFNDAEILGQALESVPVFKGAAAYG